MPEPHRSQVHSYQQPASAGVFAGDEAPSPSLRTRLLQLATVPLAGAVLTGAAVMLILGYGASGLPDWALPAVLGTAAILLGLIAFLAAKTATRTEADLRRRVTAVRRSTVETHYKVWQVLDDLQRATPPDQRWSVPLPNPAASARTVDETIALLAAEARHLRAAAEAVAARGVQAPPPALAPPPVLAPVPLAPKPKPKDDEPGVGVFVNRARRLQVLAHKEIVELDFLERQVEEPELLKGLFSVDHLATRVRRHAENLAVLGGGPSHRQWSRPVNVYEAVRSAVAEVEHYARVKLVRPMDGTLKGHAVADVIHLLAELIENATIFSAPDTQVLIRVTTVRTGLAIEVEDRGLGMAQADREFYNAILADPGEVDLEALLADGRIGLYVVSQLAKRHRVAVQLQSNIFGGTQAVMVVPEEILGGGRSASETKEPEQPQLPSVRLGEHTGQHARPQAGPRQGPDTGAIRTDTGAIRKAAHRATEPAATGSIPVAPTPPAQHVPTPPALPSAPAPADTRPPLPKRSRQSHLAPQLRAPQPDPQQTGTASDAGHDPGLMAAFQLGRRRADEPDSEAADATTHRDEES
ncbi:ATP-binding protein [Glycomyces sp. NPDC046736]|uniref:sensor histidine kinase n=1 Tax=Glycomyces sp. NPDC046736 TaxID=3155615 RepID=UPI0033C3C99B